MCVCVSKSDRQIMGCQKKRRVCVLVFSPLRERERERERTGEKRRQRETERAGGSRYKGTAARPTSTESAVSFIIKT